jgi:DeoR family transcriptional regulator, suf operon transcriptional repressor
MGMRPTHQADKGPAMLPLGQRGLRSLLLIELKKAESATAKQLAAGLGVSLNAVRHHLRELERDGLVYFERRHRGVGAPAFTYRLTASGHGVFPRRYESALADVLDHVVEREGRQAALAILEARYVRQAQELEHELAGSTPEDKLAAVARLFSDQGYMAEATAGPDGGSLIQHNCAIEAVAQQFPEICAAEARFLAEVLGAHVERERHLLAGCSACEYRVRFTPAQPETGQEADNAAPAIEEKS